MENPYLPKIAKIINVKQETPIVKTFTLKLEEEFHFKPGQFVELSVFGVGEAPFGLSSSSYTTDKFEVSVMKAGKLTEALHSKKTGDYVGIRGPYGNGYPVEKWVGKNITIVGGGIGLSPLRSLILYLINEKEKYKNIWLLYGAKTPHDLVYKEELAQWRDSLNVNVSVDVSDENWVGNVGVVTILFDIVKIPPSENISVVCGPPIMMKFVVRNLTKIGFTSENIYLSLERMMKCGIGKCGHCNIGKYYVCQDGPVFTYEQVKDIPNPF